MMIIGDGKYISRVFYMELLQPGVANSRGNLLAYLYKGKDADNWSFDYRVRWYAKTSHEDDKLLSTCGKHNGSFDAALESARNFFAIVSSATNGKVEEIEIESDSEDIYLQKMVKMPWFHIKNAQGGVNAC